MAVIEVPVETPVKCGNCDHTFHAGRCFSTTTVGRHYAQCPCKKGVRDGD